MIGIRFCKEDNLFISSSGCEMTFIVLRALCNKWEGVILHRVLLFFIVVVCFFLLWNKGDHFFLCWRKNKFPRLISLLSISSLLFSNLPSIVNKKTIIHRVYAHFNPLLPETFLRANFEIYPKIDSHRLPTHRRGAHRNFFHDPLKKDYTVTIIPVSQ